MARAVIFGCSGLTLSPIEQNFFTNIDPFGFILFARNLHSPKQIKRLCASLRESVGRDAPILIDQEGGRVARLGAPQWNVWPTPLQQMQSLPQFYHKKAMYLRYRLIALELSLLGININCVPMLDVPMLDTHAVIVNRCYGYRADTVTDIGRVVAKGLLAGGVLPVMKHIPGHGRTHLDSHYDLPYVIDGQNLLQKVDFYPFKKLSNLPMAMSAHVVYQAFDTENCATFSKIMINVIRYDIGFDGLLITDDISMGALSGDYGQRVEKALTAGCDIILHCNGKLHEMQQIAAVVPILADKSLVRANTVLQIGAAHAIKTEVFDAHKAQEWLKILFRRFIV